MVILEQEKKEFKESFPISDLDAAAAFWPTWEHINVVKILTTKQEGRICIILSFALSEANLSGKLLQSVACDIYKTGRNGQVNSSVMFIL